MWLAAGAVAGSELYVAGSLFGGDEKKAVFWRGKE